MSDHWIRVMALLACVLLVSGACPASGAFPGFTSMFTAFALPSTGRAQAAPLGNSDFLWKSLGMLSDTAGSDVSFLKSGLGLGFTKAPAQSSGSLWTSSPLVSPGDDWNANPGMTSYKSFLKRYMNDSANIYED